MNFGISLAVSSALFLVAELLIFKYMMKKNPDVDDTMLLWLYRWGSMGFISLYLLYEIYTNNEKVLRGFVLRKSMLWVTLASFFSAATVVTFYRSIQQFDNVGVPNAVRSIAIPLTFILSMIILGGEWKEVDKMTWGGMGCLVVGIGLLIFASVRQK